MADRREVSPYKPRFDATINLGHILTMITLVCGLFAFWNSLDKRILVLEVFQTNQNSRDKAQDDLSKEKTTEIKDALRDVSRKLEKLTDAVAETKGAVKK